MNHQSLANISPNFQPWNDTILSKREQEVLQLVAMGYTNAQIGFQLAISPNTVKIHLRHIFEKLSVESRTQAALLAVVEGWVNILEVVQLKCL